MTIDTALSCRNDGLATDPEALDEAVRAIDEVAFKALALDALTGDAMH